MRENIIERHLCNLVSKAGGRAYKWVSPGNKGVPDRLVFLHGVIFLVELKATGGKLSAMQRIQQKMLALQGHHTVVLSSKEQVSEWVEMQSNALAPLIVNSITRAMANKLDSADSFRGNSIGQIWYDESPDL